MLIYILEEVLSQILCLGHVISLIKCFHILEDYLIQFLCFFLLSLPNIIRIYTLFILQITYLFLKEIR